MERIIDMLHSGNHSCVVENGGVTTAFSGRGVSDLYDMVKNRPEMLRGAAVADKVIGKAAAALLVLGGVGRVYADVISEPALELLSGAGVETCFGQTVPVIKNRAQTGWCPLETICRGEESAAGILPLIERFIAEAGRASRQKVS